MAHAIIRCVALAAVGLLPLVAAGAGLPPGRGLPAPTAWGKVYSANQFSAICVGCHTENPSTHTPPAVSFPSGDTDVLYRGTHFVRNQLDGANHTSDTANSRVTGWEKLTAWATGAMSKYGDLNTDLSVTGAAGQVLCESCHNLVRNGGRKLVVDALLNATGAGSPLCEGCHGNMLGSGHHPMGSVNNADGAAIRNPPSPDSDGVSYYGTGGNQENCVSCHKVHDAQTSAGGRVLRRGSCRVPATAIPGILNKAINVVMYAGKPPTYKGVAVTYAVGDVANLNQGTGEVSPDAAGIMRQADLAPFGERLVANGGPLCETCHKYDD